jgi:hypothetical protein
MDVISRSFLFIGVSGVSCVRKCSNISLWGRRMQLYVLLTASISSNGNWSMKTGPLKTIVSSSFTIFRYILSAGLLLPFLAVQPFSDIQYVKCKNISHWRKQVELTRLKCEIHDNMSVSRSAIRDMNHICYNCTVNIIGNTRPTSAVVGSWRLLWRQPKFQKHLPKHIISATNPMNMK